jgi:hypothetical protein
MPVSSRPLVMGQRGDPEKRASRENERMRGPRCPASLESIFMPPRQQASRQGQLLKQASNSSSNISNSNSNSNSDSNSMNTGPVPRGPLNGLRKAYSKTLNRRLSLDAIEMTRTHPHPDRMPFGWEVHTAVPKSAWGSATDTA